MKLHYAHLSRWHYPQIFNTFMEAFADYAVSMSYLTRESLLSRWIKNAVDFKASVGAFDGERMVGIATLRRGVRPGVDQLEALFVDRAHRRMGVATALVAGIEERSRAGGARCLYVSATPSESAVGLYRSRGFAPTADPIEELLALEPEDIHMVLRL